MENVTNAAAGQLTETVTESFLATLFPELWKYLSPSNVTDVDYNSGHLWISTVEQDTQRVDDPLITEYYMRNVAQAIAVNTSREFNATADRMYVAADTLRVTCIHESVSGGHISICIRKENAALRFNENEAVKNGYCDQKTYNMLRNCVLAHKNFTVCGIPHTGKTETVKHFSGYIPDHEKVVVIEDVSEVHYAKIYPEHNCTELSVGKYGFRQCTNDAMRMNPSWIIFGEAIGKNTAHLLETWSNGVSTMGTLHVDDTRDIADKIINSSDLSEDAERVTNQIYKNLGVAVLMRKRSKDGKIQRYIDQVAFYFRKDQKNDHVIVVKNGILYPERLPQFLRDEIEAKCGRDIFLAPKE